MAGHIKEEIDIWDYRPWMSLWCSFWDLPSVDWVGWSMAALSWTDRLRTWPGCWGVEGPSVRHTASGNYQWSPCLWSSLKKTFIPIHVNVQYTCRTNLPKIKLRQNKRQNSKIFFNCKISSDKRSNHFVVSFSYFRNVFYSYFRSEFEIPYLVAKVT